jgi:hypothetical protein
VTPGPASQHSPWREHEHPEPTVPGAQIPQQRTSPLGVIPAWPAAMIEPSESELARWSQLWRNPQAALWVQAGQEHAVAILVRAELRCGPRRPSGPAGGGGVRLGR